MAKENISQRFRLKNIDEKRNYFAEEIEKNAMVSKKHKKVCSSYIEQFFILVLIVLGCI